MHMIEETTLFKAILKYMPDTDKEDLIDQLAAAQATGRFDFNAIDFNQAMLWAVTPQGRDYWEQRELAFQKAKEVANALERERLRAVELAIVQQNAPAAAALKKKKMAEDRAKLLGR